MAQSFNRETQCRICHAPLKPQEKPRPGEPGFCDPCLRSNQTRPLEFKESA